MSSNHKYSDSTEGMGISRSAYRASVHEPTPRHQLKGLSSKPFRQMRRDLNGAFGRHTNTDSANDMRLNK